MNTYLCKKSIIPDIQPPNFTFNPHTSMKHHLLITAMMLVSLTPAAKTLRLGDNPAQLLKSTTVALASTKLANGIYVVCAESPTSTPDYKKILIK